MTPLIHLTLKTPCKIPAYILYMYVIRAFFVTMATMVGPG